MQPGEIYWVDYPSGGGHEQMGRRPSVVLQDDTFAAKSPLVFTIPLTSKTKGTRYPGVVFIPADAQNGLTTDSYALVFQLRATDRVRIQDKLGEVSPAILADLYKILDALTGHP